MFFHTDCLTLHQVSFPDCVRWTTIEFDPQCGTAQPEDVLRLLIPSRTLHLSSLGSKPLIHDTINTWTELKKFSGSTGWPTTVLVLPGNKRQQYWTYCLEFYSNIIVSCLSNFLTKNSANYGSNTSSQLCSTQVLTGELRTEECNG